MKDIEETEYMTAGKCARICCFKTTDPIKRMVRRGVLPGVMLQHNRMLIPAKAFWAWFHAKDIKPKDPQKLATNDVVFVPATKKRSAHFKLKKKEPVEQPAA